MTEIKRDLQLVLTQIKQVNEYIATEGEERKNEWIEEKNIIMDKQRLIERRLNNMDKASKRNNIVMSNYKPKEGMGRKLTTEIEALLQEKTGQKVMVEAVQEFKSFTEDRLIVTMKDFEEKLTALRKKKSICLVEEGKMRPMYVNDDLIREDQEIQKKARDVCREAKMPKLDTRR